MREHPKRITPGYLIDALHQEYTEQVNRSEKLEKEADLAEKLLDRELEKGAVFSEALCDWSIRAAKRQLENGE